LSKWYIKHNTYRNNRPINNNVSIYSIDEYSIEYKLHTYNQDTTQQIYYSIDE